MKLTEFAWKEVNGHQVLDCTIAIEPDGGYSIENHEGQKESFASREDLISGLDQALRERSS